MNDWLTPLNENASVADAGEWVLRFNEDPGGPPHWDDIMGGDLPTDWPEFIIESANRANKILLAEHKDGIWAFTNS